MPIKYSRMRKACSFCACAQRYSDGEMEVDAELTNDVASLRAILSESAPSLNPGRYGVANDRLYLEKHAA